MTEKFDSETFRIHVENSIDVIFSLDQAGTFTFLSPAWERHFGFSIKNSLGKTFIPFVHPDDVSHLSDYLQRVLSKDDPETTLPFRVKRMAGDYLWFVVNGRRHKVDSGQYLFIGIGRDITSEVSLKMAVLESTLFYEQIIRSADEGIIVYDADLRYKIWNTYMERLSGIPANDVLGKHPEEVFPFLKNTRVIDRIKKSLSGERVSPEDFPYLVEKTGKSGWTSDSVSPLKDPDGKITGVIGTVRDISRRKSVEEELRASEAKLRMYIDHAPDGIVVVDNQGQILEVNPAICRITGYSAQELTGMTLSAFLAEDSHYAGIAHFKQLIETGSATDTLWHRHKNGSNICLTVSAVKLSETRAMGFLKDVTEKKRSDEERIRYEAQMRQSQKLESIGQLAGGIAHELNNLLGGMIGNTEISRSKVDPASTAAKHLAIALDAGERAARLIAELLAFARKSPNIVAPVDANELLHHTCELARNTIGKKIKVSCDLHASPALIMADAASLQTAILALAVNARDAMESGGRLIIETHTVVINDEFCKTQPFKAPAGDYLDISVSDTGIGMNTAVLSRLFEPFFTTKAQGKGSGLGLSVVYGCVKQHNGYIKVHSVVGQGTTFNIYLPLAGKIS
ncbi:MAG: PAS domain S-box protein [Chitinispirillaceae bacterium]|nr:PAS domain S-box protein [Chitinispirillaceae bacterium]